MQQKYKHKIEELKEIVQKLQVADIILSRDNRSWMARALCRAAHSNWSHISLVMAVPDESLGFDNVLVVEAMYSGVQIHRIQRLFAHPERYDIGVKRFPGLTDAIKERVVEFMINNVDEPYDYLRLIGYILDRAIGGLLWPHKEHFIHKEDFVCSTFTQKAFYSAMPPDKKRLVLFREDLELPEAIEEIGPWHIAQSTKCKWIYNEKN